MKMGKKAMSILAVKDEEFYEGMGIYFVALTQKTGFADVLKALGRNLRDMLLNLDNLHEYLRSTFSRIKPPSFFIVEESESREYIVNASRVEASVIFRIIKDFKMKYYVKFLIFPDMKLQYRSKRRGFQFYVQGQVIQLYCIRI